MSSSAAFRRRLLVRLSGAVGLGLVVLPGVEACGGKAVIDPEGAGGSTSTTNATNGTTVTNATVSTSTGMPMCTETTTTATGGVVQHYTRCLDQSPCPTGENAFVLLSKQLEAECCVEPDYQCEYLVSVECGPFNASFGSCCFEVVTEIDFCAVPGRPLRVEGRAVTARPVSSSRWNAELTPDVGALGETERRALYERWSADALMEHASIASFSRFALALLAVGAPTDLVQGAHRAALDEVEHARDAFALASAYLGRPCGPGALPMPSSLPLPTTLAELAVETFVEGCLNETVAVVQVAERLERASDPAVRRALARVAEDEARHSELAWRTVSWALREGGSEVRNVLSDVLRRRAIQPEQEPDHTPIRASLVAHGQLSVADLARASRQALREIVQPCAERLLEA
jgi:hypothetical protein